MKFGNLDHYFTGVAVPLGALKTKNSCGIGEYPDLVELGKWCRKIEMEVIQILPINDSGDQSSPYSALSAFALHPIYLNLDQMPGSENFKDEIEQLKKRFDKKMKIPFSDLRWEKIDLLIKIFKGQKAKIPMDILSEWQKNNPWVRSYAAYLILKEKHQSHWKEWGEYANPKDQDINKILEDHPDDFLYHSWIQFHCEAQLKAASHELDKMSIRLKGDIPILMNEDSVDIWRFRDFFNLDMKAGAPPDMFSQNGQNWDFPTYNWEALEQQNYSWWKQRLKQAAKFYHAYRIDHVLGFFRIWQIPSKDVAGKMGHYYPCKNISEHNLEVLGFDKGRQRWLSVPHISGNEIRQSLGSRADYVKASYLDQIPGEDLYNLKKYYESERKILSLEEDQGIKDFLLYWHQNRTLLKVGPNQYQRMWNFLGTKAFGSLSYEEKQALEKLFKEKEAEADKVWGKNGEKLLQMMVETTDMLVCAEDLGVVPPSVPKVLQKLSILSLKIERWTREYEKPHSPFIDVKDYPFLSVCIPSVHDTSTLRGWWDEEASVEDKHRYYELLKCEDPMPVKYDEDLAELIIKRNLSSSSALCLFQPQDLFYLEESLALSTTIDDRINIPGTVSQDNWTYRFDKPLEEIIKLDGFNQKIAAMVRSWKQQKLPVTKH
ncbi:MAG: 4-alpha-glucanotransferase [Spirochaetales bacterium]|nr:4-alpha-glucanotransferase [Spirochaetales bacterium]